MVRQPLIWRLRLAVGSCEETDYPTTFSQGVIYQMAPTPKWKGFSPPRRVSTAGEKRTENGMEKEGKETTFAPSVVGKSALAVRRSRRRWRARVRCRALIRLLEERARRRRRWLRTRNKSTKIRSEMVYMARDASDAAGNALVVCRSDRQTGWGCGRGHDHGIGRLLLLCCRF